MKLLSHLALVLLIAAASITSTSAQEPKSQAVQAADLIRAKQYPAALKILGGDLATLAKKDPSFTEDQLILLRARALFYDKKHADAESACDTLITRFPDSLWKHKASFLKAHTLAARGKHDAALVIYETEATRLFSTERKDEVAQSLIEFAELFAKKPDPSDLDAPKPDYKKAYKLFTEVLDIQCSTKLQEQAHFAMIRMSGHLQAWDTAVKDSLTFLKIYDPTWRGTLHSQQRLTFQKNNGVDHPSPQRSEVRYRMAEALHRSDQRTLAVRYLDELSQLMAAGTIESPAGLAADAAWLKLMAMRRSGGSTSDIILWVTTAETYLKQYPNHLHASQTAFLVPSMLASHQQAEKAIAAYQAFLKNPITINKNPESLEKESPAEFLKRKENAERHREEASYRIGQLHLTLHQFTKARAAWNQTAKDYPNGARWADSQKGLVEVDYQQATQAIRKIHADDEANKDANATRASTLLSQFLKAHPLSDKAPQILYLLGRIPHQLATDMDSIANLSDEQKATQKKTFQHAIQVWAELLSKYPKSSETSQAKEQIGTIYEQRLGDLEKALNSYKQSGSQVARTRHSILTSKRLIASSPKVFRTDENPELTLSLRNIEKVTIRQYWLDLDSYFRKARKLQNISELDVDLVEPDKQWDIDIEGYQKYLALEKKIPLPFAKGKPGVCVVKVEGGGFISTTVIVRSDIDIAVRSSKKELIALATNWRKGGNPTPGVKLLIADGGKVVATGTTGKDGVLHFKTKELEEINDLRILALSASGAATCDLDLSSLIAAPIMLEKAWFNTPRQWYRPGEMIQLSGLLRSPANGAYQIPPADHRKLTLTCIEQRTGRLIHKAPVTLNDQGSFSTKFIIPPSMKNGMIAATLSRKEGENSIDFDTRIVVKNEQRNRVILTLDFARSWTTPGEKVTGKISARYHWGAAVTNREVVVTLPNKITLKLPTDAEGNASFDFDTSMQASGSIASFSATMPSESSNTVRKLLDIDPLGYSIEADVSHGTIAAGETFEIIAKTLLPDASATSKELTLEIVQQHLEKADPILDSGNGQYSQRIQRQDVQHIQSSQRRIVSSQSTIVREVIVQTHKLTTDAAEGLAKQKVTLKEGGRFILRIRGTDDRGRLVFAESFIEIYGEDSTQKLRLLVDRNKLHEGGTATIDAWSRLKTPSTALLSIEADALIEYRLVKVTPGKNQIKLPLTQRHAPVFRVAIIAMHDRKFYASDEILPVERILKVVTEIQGLNDDNEATPATQLKVHVKVHDGNESPQDAEVSLALVDDRDPHTVINTSPFVRSRQLAGFTLGTSCGLQHQGTQSKVNLTVRAEEQRMNNAPNQPGPRPGNDLQLALQSVDFVRKNLYMGEGYYNLGKYAQAEQQFKKVLQIDKYNKAARRWLERVASVKSDYYRAAYDHTRAELLQQVDRAWEMNGAFGGGGGGNNDDPFGGVPNQAERGVSNTATGGLRSGNYAITRNNIDAILNNPNRNSIDAVFNNANGRGFINNSSNANWTTRNYFGYVNGGINGNRLASGVLPPLEELGVSSMTDNTIHHHKSTHIWALSLQRIDKEGTTLELPLPAQSGTWKLLTHASTPSGNLGQSIDTFLTRLPYTLSLQAPGIIIEGDQVSPTLLLTRKNTDIAETINVTLATATDEKEIGVKKHVFNFKKGESTSELIAQTITVPDAQSLNLTIKGDKQLELKRTLPIRPWGLPVADRSSGILTSGKKSITLEIPAEARQRTMKLHVTPGMPQALRQLATAPHASLYGWHIPFHQGHPAGQLLAVTSVIDHARKQGLGDDKVADLIERSNRLAAELTITSSKDGSWSSVTGRSKGELSHTAMAFEALKLAQKLKLNVDAPTIHAAQQWLSKQQASIESNDVDARSLVQYALSCADAADFSTCNRLFRERGKLGDAGKALLAATFVNLKRPENAKTLLSSLAGMEKWTTKSKRILCSKTFIAGRALTAAATATPDAPLRKSLQQYILSHVGAGGFTLDLDRGAALVGLCRAEEKSAQADARITISLNGKPLGEFTTDKPELLSNITVPANLIVAGKNSLSFNMEGKGKLYAAATLSGFTPIPAKADQPAADEKFAVKWPHYFREGLSFQGHQLRASGTSPAKTVRTGERVRVQFGIDHYRNDVNDAVVIARIPAGFVYEKGTLKGTHSGARIENNHLVITFDGRFKNRTFSYHIIARHPGTWRQPPTMLVPLRNPAAAVYGSTGTLTVIPATEKNPDAYVININEHAELAGLYFKQGNHTEARKHIMAIRKSHPTWENPENSRILLWIETARPNPDARLLVESFEVLNERSPDLVIPFDKILKVGKAYQELEEHERGLDVFTATIEAGFAKDAYVGAALEDQGRFLDAVDYQKDLWKLYPDEGQITEAWFALAQQVYLMAPKAEKLTARQGQKKAPTEMELIKESSALLDSFLLSTPKNPMADDAAFSQANALFSLKQFKQVVKHAHACITRYPDSKHAGSFRYMEALGNFWLRDYDAALKAASEVAHGSSEDKNLAAFITAQIYHAKGQPLKATEWYEVVEAIYPDARESIAYFEQKMVRLDEAKILKSGEKAQMKLRFRNIKEAHLQIYRVDLMKLYLREKSLSNVANVNLAGIAPKHKMTVKLGDGQDFRDREKLITLPVKDDGAYLVICRGDYLYTSGLALITPLKMEVQENLAAHSLRVNISDRTTGKYIDNVHVKAIGLNDSKFKSGETDLRGVWKAENINNRPTVIARDAKGRYAFFRSTSTYQPLVQQEKARRAALKPVDFNSNINTKQQEIQKGNNDKYNQFRRSKGKGVKAEKALKK